MEVFGDVKVTLGTPAEMSNAASSRIFVCLVSQLLLTKVEFLSGLAKVDTSSFQVQ